MVLPVILVSNDWLRGFNRGFSIFFNIEKLLFCLLSYVNVPIRKMLVGMRLPQNVQKFGMCGAEDISFSIGTMIM